MTEKFASPSTLREFALETASQLRAAGQTEACEVMEAAATSVTSSGWEWLGELGAAAASIREISGIRFGRSAARQALLAVLSNSGKLVPRLDDR
jgi:hypothetical protein